MHSFFFFTAPSPSEIYTLSLHDALPIFPGLGCQRIVVLLQRIFDAREFLAGLLVLGFHEDRLEYNSFENSDRKSTRLNSSHVRISYAVFCLKKKKQNKMT